MRTALVKTSSESIHRVSCQHIIIRLFRPQQYSQKLLLTSRFNNHVGSR